MAVNKKITECTELAEGPALADLLAVVDISDATDAASGTTKKNKSQYALGLQVNLQTGTTYTYLTADFRKLVTHSNGSAIAGTLPQAGASFPAGWFMVVQNRGAGALTITPTTSTIDGAATLILNQNEGAIVVSDGTNYFTLRGKQAGGGSPGAHGSTHENGGADEINVAGLSGVLADPQVPITENVQDIVGVMVVAGTNVTVTYNDGAGTLTIDSTGGGSIAPLVIEGANEVSQRNSTNNQNFSVYRNYNSGSDYQRIRIGWTGTAAEIMSEAATQGASNLILKVSGGTGLNLSATDLQPATTDVFVLGGASKYFSEVYSLTWITKSGGMLRFVGGARVTGPAQGIINWTDDTGNSGSGTIRFDNRTPATITSDQNNYSVPVTGYFIRLSTDASRTLTGLTFGGGGVGDGQVHLLVNVGANDLVLAHENASSTAGNRFLNSTGANITLSANQAAEIIYDGTTARWRVFKRN